MTDPAALPASMPAWMPTAPADAEAVALLRPAVGGTAAAGWIGGLPCLPDGMAWPERGGLPVPFVAQIALAALRPGLWAGSGPRHGWLRLFLTGDLHPVLIHTETRGEERAAPSALPAPAWQETRIAPRWSIAAADDDAPGSPDPRAAVDFDLSHPGCQPVDRASALTMIEALREAVAHSSARLATFETDTSAVAAPPGHHGIWGSVLRRTQQAAAEKTHRRLVNPGQMQAGKAALAEAEAALSRLHELLQRAHEPLPEAALDLVCGALDHVTLPLIAMEAAPDAANAPDVKPMRLYQRDVPATRSAWAPRAVPRSSWAEEYIEHLFAHVRRNYSERKLPLARAKRLWWNAVLRHHAEAATLRLGPVDGSEENLTLLCLPSTALTGWGWGSDHTSLDIRLPLATLQGTTFRGVTARITG